MATRTRKPRTRKPKTTEPTPQLEPTPEPAAPKLTVWVYLKVEVDTAAHETHYGPMTTKQLRSDIRAMVEGAANEQLERVEVGKVTEVR